MRIGILGTRGIPNNYGGFEQFAQYLSVGLVQHGHSVWVYNSSNHPYREKKWEDVNIVRCSDWENYIGSAGQFVYDYNCLKDARKRGFDILLQLGYTSNSIWHRLWPKDAINVINMDGMEWKRSKYGPLTQKFLLRAEHWAAKHGDILVADSTNIRDYIQRKYHRPPVFIPYGAEIPENYEADNLGRWGLRKQDYFLLMARMEPENNIEMIIRGWMASDRKKPLVLIGNPDNSFGAYLQKTYRKDDLLFVGGIYETGVANALRHYSSFYFHGHSVGGTNPSLLEAMACECAIFAHNNSFNKTVLGKEAGYFGSENDIAGLLERLPAQAIVDGWKQVNTEKIRNMYTWESIIDSYEQLFLDNLQGRKQPLPKLQLSA